MLDPHHVRSRRTKAGLIRVRDPEFLRRLVISDHPLGLGRLRRCRCAGAARAAGSLLVTPGSGWAGPDRRRSSMSRSVGSPAPRVTRGAVGPEGRERIDIRVPHEPWRDGGVLVTDLRERPWRARPRRRGRRRRRTMTATRTGILQRASRSPLLARPSRHNAKSVNHRFSTAYRCFSEASLPSARSPAAAMPRRAARSAFRRLEREVTDVEYREKLASGIHVPDHPPAATRARTTFSTSSARSPPPAAASRSPSTSP